MRTLVWSSTLACVALLGSAQQAQAWTKVRNDTPNPIFLLYALSADSGLGCGYDDPCTDDVESSHITGWFVVQPGQSLQINGNSHHNGIHEMYAEDDFGHSWTGDNGFIPGFPRPQSIDACFYIAPDIAGSTWYPSFMMYPQEDCCGFLCGPEDWEEKLTLDPAAPSNARLVTTSHGDR